MYRCTRENIPTNVGTSVGEIGKISSLIHKKDAYCECERDRTVLTLRVCKDLALDSIICLDRLPNAYTGISLAPPNFLFPALIQVRWDGVDDGSPRPDPR